MSVLLNPLPGAGPLVFPLRLAAIDVGSNAIRFLAAEFTGPDAHTTLEFLRAPVRLGRDAFRARVILPDAMEAAADAIAGYRKRMDGLGVLAYRAVATSAVRDSRNGGEFMERVWHRAGVRIETITGVEEARLVWLAVRRRVELGSGRWLAVDLGGGSVELSLVEDGSVRWSETYPLGTVRLLEELGEAGLVAPSHVRELLERHPAMLRLTSAARGADAAGMIATGGNIEALADLAGARPGAGGGSSLGMEALQSAIVELARLTPAARVAELGLREDRADVILPAAVLYHRIAEVLGVREIVVPRVGVKEGLLFDVLEDVSLRGAHEQRLEEEAVASALALGERCRFDRAHAEQVTRLALALFDQLRELHRLGAAERRMLAAAAVLHDVGKFVANRRHHKHSHYLIAHSEIAGFTPREINLVALVARYHRRAEPSERHDGYGDLPRKQKKVVDRLAAILRIADALDRDHQQRVTGVTTETAPDGDHLTLLLHGAGLTPEEWPVPDKARLFKRVFGLDLRLRPATAGAP